MTDPSLIRNFSIIAHVDHGKSTLADRLLEITGTVEKRAMKQQLLDNMELERERGITIKARAVSMNYKAPDGNTYLINLIDTPGHVDFNYEVLKSLQACEGALLLVDASQGVEAQTVVNAHLAEQAELQVVPVLNKMDLPHARPDHVAQQVEDAICIPAEDAIAVSAKTGLQCEQVLDAIVKQIPPPTGDPAGKLQALMFDAVYNDYRGVVIYVRVMTGTIKKGDEIIMLGTETEHEVLEVGKLTPEMEAFPQLSAGEVGRDVEGGRFGHGGSAPVRGGRAPRLELGGASALAPERRERRKSPPRPTADAVGADPAGRATPGSVVLEQRPRDPVVGPRGRARVAAADDGVVPVRGVQGPAADGRLLPFRSGAGYAARSDWRTRTA